MKLFLMAEVKGNLSEKEKEDLCWKMMEGSDVYNMICRESIEELNNAQTKETAEVKDGR